MSNSSDVSDTDDDGIDAGDAVLLIFLAIVVLGFFFAVAGAGAMGS